MDKNLTWKIVLIAGLVILAVWTLYPPDKTLKPGIDLGGGTSLIYEVDAKGLSADEKRGLSERVITVLRRRIDPANIQNLVWRPQGSTRFEIQMPLASAEAREKRTKYETLLNDLLSGNVTQAVIMRSVAKPAEQRTKDFERYARDSNDRMRILNEFAKVYDERKEMQKQRDDYANQMATPESLIKMAGLKLDDIKLKVNDWAKLEGDKRKQTILDYLGSEGNLDLLTRYTEMYAKWAQAADRLTEPENGLNAQFAKATQALSALNLSSDQVTAALEAGTPGSAKSKGAVEVLKKDFPELSDKIDKVAAAYNAYFPFRGRLDDPSDLQRMLKGAGILEFRILPSMDHPEVDSAQMKAYVDTLKTKGPKYPVDDQYVWLEVEKPAEWHAADRAGRPVITGQFGEKYYVLASNRKNKDEVMLHTGGQKDWKLVKSTPGQDQSGRRAIDFELDERGGKLFSVMTAKNLDRPLCIVLDGMAISAPNIHSRIYTNGQISGTFKQTEIEDMVSKLNAGSLPARLIEQPVSVKTIGPSIGADNLQKGLKSGVVGLICVVLFMLVYYTIGGAIADCALLLNILFLLAIMAGLSATFTLPGIAGVILTIGMAVDANVLIFERIREEQAKGSSLAISIKNGYERAFSAIFDSNVTTIMTAAILYWVASEEIKGFAITLILGLSSSLFTSLFVTRIIFDLLLKKKILKDHLVFLHLIRKPNIDWMKALPVFLTISAILTIGGVTLFLTRDDSKNSKYDIEFTGGTSVQINLRQGANLDRQKVEDIIHQEGEKLNDKPIAAATVYSVGTTGSQYEITTTETNKTKAFVAFSAGQWTPETVTAAIKKAESAQQADLPHLLVTPDKSGGFVVTTSQLNKNTFADVLKVAFPDANISEPQFDEVVTNAVVTAFGDNLEIRKNLQPIIVSAEKITDSMIDYSPQLTDFVGGVAIRCDLETAAPVSDILQRFSDLRSKPDMMGVSWYAYRILDSDLKSGDPNQETKSFVYVVGEPEIASIATDADVWAQFVDGEKSKVTGAMQLSASLPSVTQISPSIGKEAKTAALIAAILSLIAMLVYLALRFGDLRYGIGGIVTLAHDTTATMGALMCCAFIAPTFIGQALLIGDFKIDMTMVGAFLTLLGYSINDTIIIYDRIRENRRKGTLTPQLINDSINATLSRTILTSTTVFLVVFIMYVFGGKGLRGFNFAMLFGVIEGTYSSIAISAPILLLRSHVLAAGKPASKQQQD